MSINHELNASKFTPNEPIMICFVFFFYFSLWIIVPNEIDAYNKCK